MDVEDAAGKEVEERLRQELHVAGARHDLHAAAREPGAHCAVAFLTGREDVELEDRRLDAGAARPVERLHARLVRGHGGDREPVVDHGLQARAAPRDEDADHRSVQATPSIPCSSRPITRKPALAASSAGTTAQYPMPRLKTRRCSSSGTPCSSSHAYTGGRSQLPASRTAPSPAGRTRGRLPGMPPPVTWASARTSRRGPGPPPPPAAQPRRGPRQA